MTFYIEHDPYPHIRCKITGDCIMANDYLKPENEKAINKMFETYDEVVAALYLAQSELLKTGVQVPKEITTALAKTKIPPKKTEKHSISGIKLMLEKFKTICSYR